MRRELDIEPASRPVSERSPGPEARRARDQSRLGDGCLLDYVRGSALPVHHTKTRTRAVGKTVPHGGEGGTPRSVCPRRPRRFHHDKPSGSTSLAQSKL